MVRAKKKKTWNHIHQPINSGVGEHFSSTNSYPWAIISSFISLALVIKYCPNTGWHTSLSFTLAQIYSTQSPLITCAPVYFACDFWEPTDATFYRKCSHLTRGTASLISCSHNTRQAARCVYFHVYRWKVIHLVQWSPVLSSMACRSAICCHISVFPPAMVFSPPGRIKSVHHPICQDHRFGSNMLWTTKIINSFVQRETQTCSTTVLRALQMCCRESFTW